MRYKISVLRKDIKEGVCHMPSSCAVALAVNRRFGKVKGYTNTEVIDFSAILYFNNELPTYADLPQKVRRFLRAFDATGRDQVARKKLKPFNFTVNV